MLLMHTIRVPTHREDLTHTLYIIPLDTNFCLPTNDYERCIVHVDHIFPYVEDTVDLESTLYCRGVCIHTISNHRLHTIHVNGTSCFATNLIRRKVQTGDLRQGAAPFFSSIPASTFTSAASSVPSTFRQNAPPSEAIHTCLHAVRRKPLVALHLAPCTWSSTCCRF